MSRGKRSPVRSARTTRPQQRLPRVGARVLLTGDHPHAGKVGRVAATDVPLAMTDRTGAHVDLDQGGACFVFDASDWVGIDERDWGVRGGR